MSVYDEMANIANKYRGLCALWKAHALNSDDHSKKLYNEVVSLVERLLVVCHKEPSNGTTLEILNLIQNTLEKVKEANVERARLADEEKIGLDTLMMVESQLKATTTIPEPKSVN